MRPLVSALLVAGLALPALATPTRTWRVTSYRELDEGEPTGVLLSSLGEATAGYATKRLEVAEAQVFSSVVAPDGTVWLGTGDQAQLYRLDARGRLEKGPKLDGVLVASLAAAPDGTIYAGTLPGGKLWRIAKGEARELAKLDGADQVWALAADGGTLYAATGPGGRLYSVDAATGKNRVLWESGEKHLLSLAADGKDGLLVGSSDEGILYRVGKDGAARAVHDFAGDEVRAISRDGGTVWVAVNEFDRRGSSSSLTPPRPVGTRISLPGGGPASVNPTRDRKGKGAIYRLDADGRVEQVHAISDGYFAALQATPEGVFAASGSSGRLYLLRADRTVLTALNLPERQILTLGLAGARPFLGTGDAGSLYTLSFTPPPDAAYLSKVLDASFPARFGAIRWGATGQVKVETRSGNTAKPDRTWSPWAAPSRATPTASEGKVASPGGRYLQFRALLGKGAVLRDVTAFYLPQNQRPRVVEVLIGEDPAQKVARAVRGAGKPRTTVVKVRWKVENPDDDDLVFRLAYREETEANWKPLGGPDPLTAKEWEWNTEAIPDGNYVLRVTASDERSNPKDLALEHALLSSPILVDNRKPEIGDLQVAYPRATGTARDGFSPLTDLAFAIDGGEWQPLAPRDGLLDEPVEAFTLQIPPGLPPGRHSLAVRATDAADNVGTAQGAFTVP